MPAEAQERPALSTTRGPADHNNGYECDGNNGMGQTNPAHTGCTATSGPTGPTGTTDTTTATGGTTGTTGGTTATGPTTSGIVPSVEGLTLTRSVTGALTTVPAVTTELAGLALPRGTAADVTTASGSLPTTGSDTGLLLAIALSALLMGTGAIAYERRAPQSARSAS